MSIFSIWGSEKSTCVRSERLADAAGEAGIAGVVPAALVVTVVLTLVGSVDLSSIGLANPAAAERGNLLWTCTVGLASCFCSDVTRTPNSEELP
jgi:hypothetical protein